MRKMRAAAVVAALVGSIGFVGAGTAAAHGGPPVNFDQENEAACTQGVEQTSASLLQDLNLGLGVGLLGQGAGEASSDRSVNVGCEIGQGNAID